MNFKETFAHDFYPFKNQAEIDRVRKITKEDIDGLCESNIEEEIFSLADAIVVGVIICIFGVWGDLAESQFKRNFGVKDSGNIMPGHGGMLDRFDALLVAAPVAYLYMIILGI